MAERMDEQQLAVARVYARALLQLAERAGRADQIFEELEQVARALEAVPEFERFLASPLFDTEVRAASVESAFRGRLDDLLTDTLQVMNRKGRLALVGALAVAYRLEYEEARGEVDVRVTTAVELDDALREHLVSAATRFTGRTARLVERVDPGLLGGMVLLIGDRKVDGSVGHRLAQVGQRLRERASGEIQSGREYLHNGTGAE